VHPGAGGRGWTRSALVAGLIATVLLLTGCAEGPPRLLPAADDGTPTPAPTDAPKQEQHLVITEQNAGQTFTLAAGTFAFLRLPSRYYWDAPEVDGTAVTVLPVYYESDPGYQEWQVQADSPGTARLHALGYDNPPDLQARPLVSVDMTFVVPSQ
jgi:hypothetical protein